MSTNPQTSPLLDPCCAIAREAGALIMGYFNSHFATRQKDDNSPVTDADIAANRLITQALAKLTPDIQIVAEEDEMQLSTCLERFWLVDPLDGTRAFVRGEKEFTVNIGLIENQKPKLGIIYAPPQDALYYGEIGVGAWRVIGKAAPERLQVRPVPSEGLTVTRSKAHPTQATADYLATLKIAQILPGSSSIKFCTIAEGNADIYPRFGRTMEWDTAAGHAILQAAGGRVQLRDGTPLTYGKPGYENPGFVATGG